MPLLARITDLSRRLGDWSWPAKFLVGAALGAIAGGGILSFLLETATHTFALSYGFRPPVEGLPYLRTLVSAGSVILLLSAALMATCIMGILAGFVRFTMRVAHRVQGFDITKLATWKVILIGIGYSLAIFGLMFFAQQHGRTEPNPYCMWPLISCDTEPTDPWQLLALTLFVNLPLVLVYFRPAWAWISAASFIVWYYSFLALTILPPDGYARLLRATGFGGGTPVEVAFLAGDTGCESPQFTGFLLLRTTETVVLYDQSRARISEVTSRCISSISYRAGGLSSLPFQLPLKNPLYSRHRKEQ